MDSPTVPDEGGTTPDFGQSVIHVGNETKVRVWGACDSGRAWLIRDRLDHLATSGQRRITLDVSLLRFADFTAVAILVGALARIRQAGAEVAVSPPSSGAYQVLKRAALTTARTVTLR
jgi:anti-sigma B factor antagonist